MNGLVSTWSTYQDQDATSSDFEASSLAKPAVNLSEKHDCDRQAKLRHQFGLHWLLV